MKLLLAFSASAILFVVTACVTMEPAAEYAPSRIKETYVARTAPEKIELFRTQFPQKKYSEIGAVSVCCGTTESLVNLMREKASEVGGDAIIAVDFDATRGATASVIRYQ